MSTQVDLKKRIASKYMQLNPEEYGSGCPVPHGQNADAYLAALGGKGLDLTIAMKDSPGSAVPVKNIPDYVSIRELRELLRIGNVPLDHGKTWNEVEFFLHKTDDDDIPIANTTTLSSLKVKNGQTIYMSYIDEGNLQPIEVLIPHLNEKISLNGLPQFSTVRGLKFKVATTVGDFTIASESYVVRRETEALPLDDSYKLKKLKANEKLIVEGASAIWFQPKRVFSMYKSFIYTKALRKLQSLLQSPSTAVVLIVFLIIAIYFMLRIINNLKTMSKPSVNQFDVKNL